MAETPTLRDISADKIVDALEFLRNFGVVDKGVREGKKTQEDIARSFTGDPTAYNEDKGFFENVVETTGLLDFTPIGTVFSAQEADRDIKKAKGTDLEKRLSLLGYLRQPLQTSLDRPDIGEPATELGAATLEALPLTYLVTRPIVGLFKSLGSKLRGDVSAPVDTDRRKFMKDSALVTGGALATLGGVKLLDKPLAKAVTKTAKVAKAVPLTFESARKAFFRPQLKSYLEDLTNDEGFTSDEIIGNLLYDRIPAFRRLDNEIDEDNYIKETYGIDPKQISVDEIMDNQKLVDDMLIDVAGDDRNYFAYKVQEMAIMDGAKVKDNLLIENPEMDMDPYLDLDLSNDMDEAVTTYYNQLLDEGMSPNDIAKQMYKEDNQLSETMALYKKKTPTK